jgi:hypothetical protein
MVDLSRDPMIIAITFEVPSGFVSPNELAWDLASSN